MAKIFLSYSHKDEALRNELEIHLAALKKQGVIEIWHDRRIGAGLDVDQMISEHLDQADIVLLLVSPYFIASEYCYDIEMNRAIELHRTGKARVIPVILHPCDWHNLPFGKLRATPTDGKPISKFPNQHDAFLDVSIAIRQAAEEMNLISPSTNVPSRLGDSTTPRLIEDSPVRTSNLRIKKKFTDREKDRFQTEAFEYLAKFFEESLAELSVRNDAVETEFRRIDANEFTAAVYLQGAEANSCRISLADKKAFFGGIAYAGGRTSGNGFNESISVNDDGYIMFLEPLGMASWGREKGPLSFEGAAEYYWGLLIAPLQR